MAEKLQSAGMMVGDRMTLHDVIEFGGERLIVVLWFGNKDLGLRRPEFVIPLKSVPHHDLSSDPQFAYRWGIDGAFPKSLFDGTAQRAERRRYGVRKGPDVTFPLPAKH